MTAPRFATRAEALKAGWFSRRHETDQAHREARENWREHRGRRGRQLRATARLREAERAS